MRNIFFHKPRDIYTLLAFYYSCNEEGFMLVLMRMDKNMSNYLEENRPQSCQQIDNILWSLSSRLCQLHRAGTIQ